MKNDLAKRRNDFSMAARRIKSKLAIDVANKQMKKSKSEEEMTDIQLLKSQVMDALAVLEEGKLPREAAIPEMIKFLIAVDLAANGPVSTLMALDGIRSQVAGIFPKSALIVEKMETAAVGTA